MSGPGVHESIDPVAGRRPALFMRWLHLAFFHWRIDPQLVQRTLPAGLTVDTFDDAAWIGLVPFTMRDVGHLTPFGRVGVPTATNFHECNVRTYVRDADGFPSGGSIRSTRPACRPSPAPASAGTSPTSTHA